MKENIFFHYYKHLFLFLDFNSQIWETKLENVISKAEKEKRKIILIPFNFKPFDEEYQQKLRKAKEIIERKNLGKIVNLPPCVFPQNIFNFYDTRVNDYFLFLTEEGFKKINFKINKCPFYLKNRCDGVLCSDWKIKQENIKIKQKNNFYFLFSPDKIGFLPLNSEEYKLFEKLMEKYNKEYNPFYFLLWRKGLIKINDVSVISSEFVKKWMENDVVIVEIELSNSCNLRCKYCYVSAGEDKPIDFFILKKIIDKILELPSKEIAVQLGGGEALLHFDLIEKAVMYGNKKAREKGKKIIWMVQSNGLLVGKFAEKLKKLNISVGISYDGPYQNIYRLLPNGMGSKEEVINSIKKARNNGLNLQGAISVIINPSQMEKIYEDIKENNFKYWKILYYFKAGRGKKENIGEMNEENQLKFAEEEFKLFKNGLKEGIILKETITKLNNLLTRHRPQVCSKTPCGAGRNFVVFNKKGEIFPCYHFIQISYFKMGDLEDSWEEIFNSKIKKELDKRFVNNLEKCKNCEFKFFCCAGCTSNAYFTYGNILNKSPMCNYYKKIYLLLMKWLKEEYLVF